jgi:dTDP-4-amino-4,6-dideoxygalactose transaminase
MGDKLAIQGGTPAKQTAAPPMFPGLMMMDVEEEEAVLAVVRSKRLFRYYGPGANQGSKTEEFERQFATVVGTNHARAVSSGTAALICALVGAGVGVGDEVIVPGYTWIASALAVIAVGAVPVIAEIDDSLGLDADDAEKKITPLTKAIIVVHMRGVAADLDPIVDVATRHGLPLIEDVAQACGGSYNGKRLGSIGNLGAFSLQVNKLICTGEGGLVTSSDGAMFARASMVHDNITDTQGRAREVGVPAIPLMPGQNYRASEFVGALGLVQLRRLESLLAAMRDRHRRIMDGICELPNLAFRRVPDAAGDCCSSLIMFVPRQKAMLFGMALTAENVPAHVLYQPRVVDAHVYAHWNAIMQRTSTMSAGFPWSPEFYKGNVSYSKDMCPRTLELCGRSVAIDVNPLLTEVDVDETVLAIRKVANALL